MANITYKRRLSRVSVHYIHCAVGMQDLKSEALRPRHWDKLMKETEKSFDMDPKTFTLANLFRMELHKFASVIR